MDNKDATGRRGWEQFDRLPRPMLLVSVTQADYEEDWIGLSNFGSHKALASFVGWKWNPSPWNGEFIGNLFTTTLLMWNDIKVKGQRINYSLGDKYECVIMWRR